MPLLPRWQKLLVMSDTGIDWRYYELCALSELKRLNTQADAEDRATGK